MKVQVQQPHLQFRDLLSEAIYAIKRKEGKKISVIQDELMYSIGRQGGNPLEYWRKGNVPTNQVEFTRLLHALITRGGLSREWLQKIWLCTEFVGLDEFAAQIASSNQPIDPLPQKSFSKFVGRQPLLEKLTNALLDENGNQLIGLDGMGGIGKTALAHSAITSVMAENKIEEVIWISDNPGASLSFLQTHNPADQYNFDFILNAIGQALGLSTIAKLTQPDKIKRLRTLLKIKSVIIVLDNLERATDLDDDMIKNLQYLVGASPLSKFLLISRRRFTRSSVFQIHLQGLNQQESINLLDTEAKHRGIERISAIADADFNHIAESTGGSPLALKLILGQLSFHDLKIILSRLQDVKLVDPAYFDEYAQMYRHIFFDSWELLSTQGKQLLISMSHFAPGKGGTYEAVKMTSDLTNLDLAPRIDELWHLALLEVGNSTVRQTRYYLHALTHHFTLSDLVMLEL